MRTALASWHVKVESTDVLTEVLSTLGIQGQVFCCSELSVPWSMALSAAAWRTSTSWSGVTRWRMSLAAR